MRYLFSILLFLAATPAVAVDSYRFLHVTIETPWMIFLFLLVVILFPFILTAVLHWHFARKKSAEQQANDEPGQ
jgi:hypothetical protein